MAKLRVSFVVDADIIGRVLVAVDGNAEDLAIAVVETVPYNKNVKRKEPVAGVSRGKAQEAFLSMLIAAPERSMTLGEARAALDKAGFAGDGIYTMRDALVKRKVIDFHNGLMRMK